MIDERSVHHSDPGERRVSTPNTEHSLTEEYEVSLDADMQGSHASSINSKVTSQEERKASLSQPDTTISLTTQDNQSQLLPQAHSSDEMKREEEQSSSSLADKKDEGNLIDYDSSTKTSDVQLPETQFFTLQDTSKGSSHDSSLTDVESKIRFILTSIFLSL